MSYSDTHLAGTVALNMIRLDLEASSSPGADQRAWRAQVAELRALRGQVSADKCPPSGQVSASTTGIDAPSLEK